MGKYRIVIDQGTSGTKGILFYVDNYIKKLDRIDLKHKQIYPNKGWVEQDPIEIRNNVEILIKKIIERNNLERMNNLSISITNQRESVLVWNRHTGKPLTNIMVWQCNRGIEICERLTSEGYNQSIKNKTGLHLDPYFSASKLMYFFENTELNKKELEDIAIGTVDTWLIWNLTKGKRFVTDISNASRTLLYNIMKKEWDEDLINLFKVPIQALPEVVSSVADFGDYNGIPIISCMADSQAALAGHTATKYGEIKATLGTGSSILMNIGQNIDSVNSSLLFTIAWEKDGLTTYATEGIIRSFGDLLNWEKDSLNLFTNFEKASKQAFSVPHNAGVYFIPSLEGLGAPFWKPEMKALFLGMTRDTKLEHLLRATFEAMGYQIRAVTDEFKKYYDDKLEHPIRNIRVDGGVSRNPEFLQMLSDITQLEIIADETEELSALGTLIVLGDKRQNLIKSKTTYKPVNSYEESYNYWKIKIEQIIKYF